MTVVPWDDADCLTLLPTLISGVDKSANLTFPRSAWKCLPSAFPRRYYKIYSYLVKCFSLTQLAFHWPVLNVLLKELRQSLKFCFQTAPFLIVQPRHVNYQLYIPIRRLATGGLFLHIWETPVGWNLFQRPFSPHGTEFPWSQNQSPIQCSSFMNAAPPSVR